MAAGLPHAPRAPWAAGLCRVVPPCAFTAHLLLTRLSPQLLEVNKQWDQHFRSMKQQYEQKVEWGDGDSWLSPRFLAVLSGPPRSPACCFLLRSFEPWRFTPSLTHSPSLPLNPDH